MAGTKNTSIGTLVILMIIIVAAIVSVILLENNNKSLTSSQQAADKQQIESNWKEFFAYSTSLSQRESLLQNGSQFASVIQSEFSSLSSAKSSVAISSVDVTNSSNASVNYNVLLNGTPVLTDQSGTAVQENGKWLVSDATICGLLKLAGTKPTACQNT